MRASATARPHRVREAGGRGFPLDIGPPPEGDEPPGWAPLYRCCSRLGCRRWPGVDRLPSTPVDWVDLVLVVVLVAAGVHGLRLGALVQVLTFGGFWLGLVLGTLLSIALVSSLRPGPVKSIVTLVVVLASATLLGVAGRVVGSWSNVALRRHHLGGLDSALGVAVAVVAVLLSAWVLGSVLSQSRYSWLGSAISRSEVLPPVPSVFAHVQAFLSAEGIPPVFAQLPPQLVSPVAVPSQSEAGSLAASALRSTVKVVGGACGVTQEGTAFEVAPGLVVTNAHVVAGEADPQIDEG